jgi:hypothetical protein
MAMIVTTIITSKITTTITMITINITTITTLPLPHAITINTTTHLVIWLRHKSHNTITHTLLTFDLQLLYHEKSSDVYGRNSLTLLFSH